MGLRSWSLQVEFTRKSGHIQVSKFQRYLKRQCVGAVGIPKFSTGLIKPFMIKFCPDLKASISPINPRYEGKVTIKQWESFSEGSIKDTFTLYGIGSIRRVQKVDIRQSRDTLKWGRMFKENPPPIRPRENLSLRSGVP